MSGRRKKPEPLPPGASREGKPIPMPLPGMPPWKSIAHDYLVQIRSLIEDIEQNMESDDHDIMPGNASEAIAGLCNAHKNLIYAGSQALYVWRDQPPGGGVGVQ